MHVFELFLIYMILYNRNNKQFMNMERMQAFQLHTKRRIKQFQFERYLEFQKSVFSLLMLGSNGNE